MKFAVEMLAFGQPGDTQDVEVPEAALAGDSLSQLETIYQHPRNSPRLTAISVGDVIAFGGNRYLVAGVGFRLLSREEYLDYLSRDQIDRLMFASAANPPQRHRF